MKDLLELIAIIAIVYFICDPKGCVNTTNEYIGALHSINTVSTE